MMQHLEQLEGPGEGVRLTSRGAGRGGIGKRDLCTVGFASSLSCILPVLGCAPRLEPIFTPPDPPIVWPASPAQSRVQYVGELRQDVDLKPPRGFLQAVGRIFVGARSPQPLYGPRTAVCTNDGERVWAADPGGRCLHLFDLKDRVYKKITKVGDAPLLSPVGVCLGREKSVYVCDSQSGSIYRLSSISGELVEVVHAPEEIIRPVALAYDSGARELYVVDVLGHDIKVLGDDGALLRILGRRGTDPGEFNFPSAIAEDQGTIWVVDTGNHRVQGLTPQGEPVAAFGQVGDAPGDMALPKGVGVDSDGNLYVVDGRFENVQVFDRAGRLLLVFGEEGTSPGAFWLPTGVYVDAADRIWICDSYNRRLQVFQYLKRAKDQP